MKYTNKYNYPDFVVEWLKHDEYDYDKNSISATTLMKPARAYALERKHEAELEIDVSELVASRYGTAIHDSVEKVKLKDCIQEKRLQRAVVNKIVTGKFDILRKTGPDAWELIDVKSTSVWTFIYGSRDEDYKKQLSIYRWLAVQNDYNVGQTAKVWMVFTDWSNSKAQADPTYPQSRIVVKEIELWGDDETLKYIGERIQLLNKAELQDQKDMPECTDEELWAGKDVYRVVKDGRKTSLKNCETKEEAELYVEEHVKKHTGLRVELKKGQVARCNYCSARKVCVQYVRLVKEGRIKGVGE